MVVTYFRRLRVGSWGSERELLVLRASSENLAALQAAAPAATGRGRARRSPLRKRKRRLAAELANNRMNPAGAVTNAAWSELERRRASPEERTTLRNQQSEQMESEYGCDFDEKPGVSRSCHRRRQSRRRRRTRRSWVGRV